ncbi:hypothetical protein M885DRAFT_527496 [Pelagophyceae sp. CCMP2097]|nr:hypothetical protein M885DRAFT_527496 [Pelagophyceae sp. CCMP2097]
MSGSVLYRFRAAYSGRDGECSISDVGVSWTDGATSVEVPFGALDKHEVSPKGHAKALLKLTFVAKANKPVVLTVLEASSERAYAALCDAKVTISTILKQKRGGVKRDRPEDDAADQQRAAKKAPPTAGNGPQQPDSRDGSALAAAAATTAMRRALLAADARLSAAHVETVGSGALSDADFWASRSGASMFASTAALAQQRSVGASNENLADLRPGAASDSSQSGTLKYTLSREKIAHIFAMYPAVKRAHAARVPATMDEATFWVKYFQSRYFMRDKGDAVKQGRVDGATDDVFARYDDPRDARDDEKDRLRRLEQLRKQTTGISRQWDLTRTQGDRDFAEERLADEPYNEDEDAILCGGRLANAGDSLQANASRVVDKLNRHADIILRSHFSNNAQQTTAKDEDGELDLLRKPAAPAYQRIDVSDREKREKALAEAQLAGDDSTDAAADAGAGGAVVWSAQGVDAAGALSRARETAGAALGMIDRKCRASNAVTAPPADATFRSDAERRFGAAAALLKHLFRFRADSDEAARPKAGRVEDRLRELRSQIETARRRPSQGGDSHAAMLKPLADQLDVALAQA